MHKFHSFKVMSAAGDAAFDPAVAEDCSPGKERVIKGDPHATAITHYTSEDGTMFAGLWQCEPGAWRIHYNEWEYFTIIKGTCIISDACGEKITVKAGEAAIIEPGFTGIWETIEPILKNFVIRLVS